MLRARSVPGRSWGSENSSSGCGGGHFSRSVSASCPGRPLPRPAQKTGQCAHRRAPESTQTIGESPSSRSLHTGLCTLHCALCSVRVCGHQPRSPSVGRPPCRRVAPQGTMPATRRAGTRHGRVCTTTAGFTACGAVRPRRSRLSPLWRPAARVELPASGSVVGEASA
jgi:hypothetical protein